MHQGHVLSFNTRKALCNQLGESAGKELADALDRLAARLAAVERDKVDVIRLVPETPQDDTRLRLAG